MLRKLVNSTGLPVLPQITRGSHEQSLADSQALDDQTPAIYRPVPHDRVVPFSQYINKAILKVEGQLEAREFRQQTKQRGSQVQASKADRAEIRSGPTSVPRRLATSAVALSTSRSICFARA
jgi:hypothetical protein